MLDTIASVLVQVGAVITFLLLPIAAVVAIVAAIIT